MSASAASRASRSACASGSAWHARCSARPQVLILDEPTNGLDPEGVHWLRQYLRAFADAGGSVLVSSHLLAEVAQTVDDVVIIAKGRLVTQSSLADLLAALAGRRPGAHAARGSVACSPRGSGRRRRGHRPSDVLMAFDTTTDAVGLAAAGAGAVIYEMTHRALRPRGVLPRAHHLRKELA